MTYAHITTRRIARAQRGFSLTEVIVAVLILGIGVISIAAVFPAGIAQQRRSVDDVIGPIVANNAMSVLRSKLRPRDFGAFTDIPNTDQEVFDGVNFVDWGWRRPGLYGVSGTNSVDDQDTPFIDAGAINVFETNPSTLSGDSNLYVPSENIPWNRAFYGGAPPKVIISQRERYYPQSYDADVSADRVQPQYVWDCMFRRFNGRIHVAIFVYRVTIPGGGAARGYVSGHIDAFGDLRPLPAVTDLTGGPFTPWDANDMVIPGTDGMPVSPVEWQWQHPGQWIVDQNNNIHRIAVGRRRPGDNAAELQRRVPQMPNLFVPGTSQYPAYDPTPFYMPPNGGTAGIDNVVQFIWYLPSEIDLNDDGTFDATLTPVYATVREL